MLYFVTFKNFENKDEYTSHVCADNLIHAIQRAEKRFPEALKPHNKAKVWWPVEAKANLSM